MGFKKWLVWYVYSWFCLIGIQLIRISGSQDFSPNNPLLWQTSSQLVCHNNGLSGEKSWSLPKIPINQIPIKWNQLYYGKLYYTIIHGNM